MELRVAAAITMRYPGPARASCEDPPRAERGSRKTTPEDGLSKPSVRFLTMPSHRPSPSTAEPPLDSRGLSPGWISLLPAAAGLLAHLPALLGTWVWDDHLVVGRQLRAFHSLSDVFFPPAGIPGFSAHYYRPLTTASYLLDRFVFGERPLGFHLTLLVAHALAASLVFLLARSLMDRSREGEQAALVAGLVFAVHPVHVESVAWITARADVMACVCLLAAALALRRRPLGFGAIAGASVLFTMGCLFKEVAYAFLAVAPLFAGWVEEGGAGKSVTGPDHESVPAGRRWMAVAAIAASAALTLLLRREAIGHLGGDAPREGASGVLALGGALAFYLVRAVVPLPAEPYAASLPGGAIAWVGIVAGVALAACALVLLRRSRGRTAGIGLASFLVLLIPSLAPALLRISSVPVAERYLYVPTAFGSLALAAPLAAWLRSPRRRFAASALVAVLLVLLGTVTALRTRIWRSETSFWTAASASSEVAFPRISLATALVEQGEHARAERMYRELLAGDLSLDPAQMALAHMNLGVVLRAASRLPEARNELEEAARRDPSQPLVWLNLASVLWELAILDPRTGTADRVLIDRADAAARRAVQLSPFDPSARLLQGRIAGSLGRGDEARAALERALELDPGGEAGETARKLLALMGGTSRASPGSPDESRRVSIPPLGH